MNTFEKHFRDFPAFIEKILSWGPDFLVPVAKKGCKLIKTIDLPHLGENPELIKYRHFFELTNFPVASKKVAVIDDATQFTATLQEYRRFFENHRAVVRTFSFVGHEDLERGIRWKEDPLAEITKYLPEPVYQEYILQQSYHLLNSQNHFDLDHLILEVSLSPDLFEHLLGIMKTHGDILFVEDYFLHAQTKRFSLNQPTFFQRMPFFDTPSVDLGVIRKIKFAYDRSSQTLSFSPLVFPTWDFRRADVGTALFQNVPFKLPYEIPDFLDKKNKSALLRAYYNIYFACVVAFAKAFIQAVMPEDNRNCAVDIKRNDLDAILGLHATDDFISSIKSFLCNPQTCEFSGPTPTWRAPNNPRYNGFGPVIDELKAGYQREVCRRKTHVGVHHFISYDTLFRQSRDPIALSEDLDYYCDFGVIVPEIFSQRGRLLRGCRAGEPNSDYNWKRTQILIPLAIDQFHAESKRRANEVEPTILHKLLANFVFDYPSELLHELHCLLGEPYKFGTFVRVYHRHRAPNRPSIYSSNIISPYYEWDKKRGTFRVKGRTKMIKEINDAFDNRQEVPYSEIVTYFKFLSKIYGIFRKVDVLNMLSICRDENCFYCHVLYNIRSSLEDFGAYMDSSTPERVGQLLSAGTNARSAFDKLQLAKQVDDTIKTVVRHFHNETEFVKAVARLKRNYVPFGEAFRTVLDQLEELVALQLILANICLLVERGNLRYGDSLKAPDSRHLLEKNGINIPEDLTTFIGDNEEQNRIIEAIYKLVLVKFDSLPREKPMLLARLQNEARHRARNIATSYVYKAKLTQAALLYVDFSGLRDIPEPKEDLLSHYYGIVEQNVDDRGGIKLYGGSGGDDAFTILFSDISPALECAKDIKKDFLEDLFLRSGQYDVKFGLAVDIFQGERKEEQIIQCWGNAKDCCEFKGQKFRNRGDILISQHTMNLLDSLKGSSVTTKFVPVEGEFLRNGSQVFRYIEIQPMPSTAVL